MKCRAAATEDTRPAVFHQVSGGYTRAMGIPLSAGRALDASDVERQQMVALVNKALVTRYFGDENPLGKTVRVPRLRQPPVISIATPSRLSGSWATR